MTSEQLFYDKKTGFDRLTDEDKQGIQTYAEGYKKFLDESKTERDAVLEIARMAESKGFRAWTRDDTLRPGDKIYRINRHKGIMLAVIGEKSLAEGVRLTAAHLDAPRVDIPVSYTHLLRCCLLSLACRSCSGSRRGSAVFSCWRLPSAVWGNG